MCSVPGVQVQEVEETVFDSYQVKEVKLVCRFDIFGDFYLLFFSLAIALSDVLGPGRFTHCSNCVL